ncbi:MAG TPA: NAD-dependent epimerase/dehydratase family protein [Blastocatellia bacterium]|nr:NAD-dependent epimerase/dehydratase family protein [Blastocatellia bacterium]
MRMKVLVIGGTGYIGGHAVESLVRRGHQVSVFARGLTRPHLPEGISFIKGDRHNPEDLARARSESFDAVMDINPYTREETQTAINLFDGSISRFVHLSTAAVYQIADRMPLVESDPLVTDPSQNYAYNKAECERALRWAHAKSGFPFVSIRPMAVFGPRDDKSRENYYIKRIAAGDPVIVPDSGAVPIYAVYVKDLAEAMAEALSAERVEGCAFNIAQSEIIALNDHISHIARLLEAEADVAHIPSRLLERLGFNLLQFPYYSGDKILLCDTGAARSALGFVPTPYLRALRETVEYFLERGPEHQKSIDDHFPPGVPRERERELIERYRSEVRALEDRLTDRWLGESMPDIGDQ